MPRLLRAEGEQAEAFEAGESMTHGPRDYDTRIWYSAEKGDECDIAKVLECLGIMTHGDTREEAAREIEIALGLALLSVWDAGIEPPVPARLAHV